MSVQKSFVNPDGIAIIKCPQCGIVKNLDAKKFQGKQHALNVRCSCGHAWNLQLDFRRHYRKETKLPGTYKLEAPGSGGGLVTILNISRNGVGFSLSGPHVIKIGQKVRLRFTLDDKKHTLIDKLAVIRAIKGAYIGCELSDAQVFQKDLGFYLRP